MRGMTAFWLRIIATATCVVGAATLAAAQMAPRAMTPGAPLPPLLYLRLVGPAGMKVTLYRGEPTGVSFDTPCIIGVRPGYNYRFGLTNVPGYPGTVFSPTLEVRGSLWLAQQLHNSEFPATVVFRADDFARTAQGGLVKKIVVLEHPETAEPVAARPDRPIEIFVAPSRDICQEVQGRGAPLAVIYLGQRSLTPEELAAEAIPGTLLLPGEKVLPAPRIAPWVPWACYPVADPVHGSRSIMEYLKLHDGGDSRLPAGYDSRGQLRGVDPTDTIAEYVDATGRPRIVASNCVALCVPRFLIISTETGIASQIMVFGPGSTHIAQGGALLNSRLPFIEQTQPLHLESTANRLKPSGTQFTTGVGVTGRINGLEITETLQASNALDVTCPPPTAAGPERPLRIIKWPDKKGCNVGEIIMFSLQFTNLGNEPITNVAVTDSLTTRFEYVPGSQKTDRQANFTVQPNEAGSSFLRWEFPGTLQPGASGLITFQVRIR